MTSPGGTQGGTSTPGFQYGQDFVAARLSFDIPADGVATLREITQEVDRFRTAIEASARTEGDFIEYLDKLTEAATRAKSTMQNLVDVMGPTTAPATGVPGTGTYQQGPGSQLWLPRTVSEATSTAEALANRDPRAYLNAQTAWGGMRVGDMPNRPNAEQVQETATRVAARDRILGEQGTAADANGPLAEKLARYGKTTAEALATGAREAPREIGRSLSGMERPSSSAPLEAEEPATPPPPGRVPGEVPLTPEPQEVPSRTIPSEAPTVPVEQPRTLPPPTEPSQPGTAPTTPARQPEPQQPAPAHPARPAEAPKTQATPKPQEEEPRAPGGGGGMVGNLLQMLGLGGMGGGLGKAGGIAGAGIGAALMAFGASQWGGEMYQGYKNMGLTRGGGAMEGIGYEMNIRTMAMNPFITTDQARQIVQTGLKEGYSGKEFDTMTGFVASNLKSMNIDISKSFDLLRTNVKEGGQSIAGLNEQLAEMKELSKTGYLTLPQRVEGYAALSKQMIQGGVPGAVAGRDAMVAQQMFAGNQTLAGTGEEMLGAMASDQGMAMMLGMGGLQLPPGTMPLPGVMRHLAGEGTLVQGGTNVLKRLAQQAWVSAGRPKKEQEPQHTNAVGIFQMMITRFGIPWANDWAKTEGWFDQLVYGENPVQQATKEVDKVATERSQVKKRNPLQMFGAGVVGAISGVGRTIVDAFNGGEFTPGADFADEMYGANESYIPAMDSVMKAFKGPGGVEVVNEAGEASGFNPADRQQLEALSSGKYKIRAKGTEGGITINQLPASGTTEDLKTLLSGGRTTQVSGAVQVTVGLQPDSVRFLSAQASPTTVKLTPHEQQANAGYGSATPNSPPPGYTMPRTGSTSF